MRLICPNCGAQYEVPVAAIPPGGRDVQCSSCGHTWFQLHPQDEISPEPPAEAAEPDFAGAFDGAFAETGDDLWEEMDEDTPDPDAAPEAGPKAEFRAGPEPEPAPQPELDPEPAATAVPRRPARARGLDPSVAEVLRQEAEREARRRNDPEPLESQPELGLAEPAEEDAAHRARVARAHMSRIRGDAPLTDEPGSGSLEPVAAEGGTGDDFQTSEPEHPAVPVSRRDLLPDIEEINQSLRVTQVPRRMETPQGRALHAEEEEQQGSNFARGFGAALIVAVLAVALYAVAPAITAALPMAAPLLDPYVAAVDGMRLWLDTQLGALLG